MNDLTDIFGTAPAQSQVRIDRVKEILKQPVAVPPLTTPVPSPAGGGAIQCHADIIQGTDEWLALRRGLITASEMKLIITPTLKVADNDKVRAHVYELAAQRITGYVEPCYISDDMLRGYSDEVKARMQYEKHFAPVQEVGFITSNKFGFTIGYSPDGLVGDDGLIECKSRRSKYQIQTLIEHVLAETIPSDYMMQIQTGLLVSERKWCDFISYSGGLPMVTIRVYPDAKIQEAIIAAATAFEIKVRGVVDEYHAIVEATPHLIPTEREIEQEIMLSYGD